MYKSIIHLFAFYTLVLFCQSVQAQSVCPQSPATVGQSSGTYSCLCSAPNLNTNVWGTAKYTSDSNLCKAALHAGKITAQGGTISYTMAGAQTYFSGTSANGVTTQSYGPWTNSYSFNTVASTAPPTTTQPTVTPTTTLSACPASPVSASQTSGTFSCQCGTLNPYASIWGTGTYTDDSNICKAAVHTGKITSQGGAVSYSIVAGLSSYPGTSANGVVSSSFGAWSRSFSFNANPSSPTQTGTSSSSTNTSTVAQQAAAITAQYTTQISGYYQTYLGRAPDQAGLNNYVTQALSGRPLSSIATEIQNSPEAKIRNMYLLHLQREPDAGGMKYWLNDYALGLPLVSIENAIRTAVECKIDCNRPGVKGCIGSGKFEIVTKALALNSKATLCPGVRFEQKDFEYSTDKCLALPWFIASQQPNCLK